MKKTKTIVIAGLILSLAVASVTVITALSICKATEKHWAFIPIFAVIGLIGGYLLHNVLHETGHCVSAKKCGAVVFEVAFCGFVFKKGAKPKFNFRSGVAGWTSFIPKNPEKSDYALKKSLSGGLTGSFFSLFIAMILYSVGIFLKNYAVVSAFGFYGAINVYLIVLNFFSSAPQTDGRLMNAVDPQEYAETVSLLEYESYLLNGISAKNIPELIFDRVEGDKISTVFDVHKSLQEGDPLRAERYVDEIISRHRSVDNGLIAIYSEKLFIEIVNRNKDEVDKYFKLIENEISEPTSLSFIRTACFYRKFNGEDDWSISLEKRFFSELEKCPLKGLKRQEKEIFELYKF